jgi:DNA polymerase I-like protein with 3'-5' exonuclease and polymerase domains
MRNVERPTTGDGGPSLEALTGVEPRAFTESAALNQSAETSDGFDWAVHTEAVAVSIFGELDAEKSRPPEDVRFGNISISLRTGQWCELKGERCGELKDLIRVFKGIDDHDAAIAYAKECRQNFENGKKPNGGQPREEEIEIRQPGVSGETPAVTGPKIWRAPAALPDLRRASLVAIDTETNDEGLRADRGSSWPWHGGWVCGLSLAWREGGEIRAIYIPIRHPGSDNFDRENTARWLKDHIAAGVRFITLNGPYDWGWLLADLGVAVPPASQLEEAGVLAALADENQREYSLDAICRRLSLPGKDTTLLEQACKTAGLKINKDNPAQSFIWQMPAVVCGPYGEGDAVSTLLAYETLIPIIEREGASAAYRLECNLMPVTIAMRRTGIRINQDAAEHGRDEFLAKRDAALKELSDQHGALVGMDEINSPKWKVATFERYGIISPRKTPKGAPSFTAGNSGWMGGHEHWLPRSIALASKYHDTACKFFQGHILDHIIGGRIYAEFNQFKTEEGGTKSLRFSVSKPPLQQMPSKDSETAPAIRRVFEADNYWAKCDVSQQEFRIMVDKAERHNLPGAKEAGDNYRNNPNADYHQYVAELAELDRKSAKQTNFMKIYGGGAAAIALKTGLSLEKAQKCVEKYDAALPFAKKLSQIYQHQAECTGITEIMGGAKRHWNRYEAPWKGDTPCSLEEARLRVADPEHPWFGQKLRRAKTYRALNAAIQGDAAIHVKTWMLACFREGITPSLQIHDELLCNVTTREQGETIARLGEEAIKLLVPMRVDLKFGPNWADAANSGQEPAGETASASPKPLERTVTASNPIEPAIAPDQRPPSETDKPIGQGDPDEQPILKSNGHDTGPPPEPCSTAIETHKVLVTVFKNEFASSLQHGLFTLPQIAAGIRTTTAAAKEDLPLLKLQRFGDKRTDKNCLRHNANVLEISGIEGEHDRGTLAFADAVQRLRNAGIRCIVYTTPSFTPVEKERWRVLAPTSQPLAPSLRAGLVARLNGILGGALTDESFVLSLAYYYGSAGNNPHHKAELLDGGFIDQRDDLAAGAIFKDGSKAGDTSGSHAGSQATGERSPSEPWESWSRS